MKPSDAIATQSQMQQQKVCVVMPTYNNGGTLCDVVERVLNYCTDVIVVNDGCTDDSAEIWHHSVSVSRWSTMAATEARATP